MTMKNEIKITELRTLNLNLRENKLGLEVFLRNIYGEWMTACWLEISDPEEMMERIFEHVIKMQGSTRAFSGLKDSILSIVRRVEDEIIDREETVEKAGIFFNKFIEAKEKYKNNELGEEELGLLETEEIDFEDENLGALRMSGAERMVYFVQRAGYIMEDMPYASLDDLERVFQLDVKMGLEEKYTGRLEELRDIGDTDLVPRIDSLIMDVGNELRQAGYDLEMESKYTMSEEDEVIEIGLEPIEELLLPDSARVSPLTIKEGEEEEYTDMLFAIEGAIADYYRENPKTKDIDVINALKNIKKGLTKEYNDGCLEDMIQMRIHVVLGFKRRTKKEVLLCLAYVSKSVKLHRRTDGVRGYLNFIIDYA